MKVFALASREALFPEASATSFYRVLMLKKFIPELDFTLSETITQNELYLYDTLYMSRPRTVDHLQFAIYAKKMGVKVVVDWDDYIWDIPQSNYARGFYSKNVRNIVAEILSVADVVTCSTDYLKDFFMQFNSSVVVIPNAADLAWQKYTLANKTPPTPRDTVRFIWAGGPSHHEEMLEIIPALKHILNLYPDKVEMIFFGGGTDFLDTSDQIKLIPRTSVLNYFSTLHETEADVMLVPLRINDFNRAKSNIRWIEATCANMATIASPLPEFEATGCVLAKDGDWFYAMQEYIENPAKIKEDHAKSLELLTERYTIDTTKGLWLKALSK
jgi:hypothetical protein